MKKSERKVRQENEVVRIVVQIIGYAAALAMLLATAVWVLGV